MSYLINTDILIDYLRDHAEAVTSIENDLDDLYLSVMNVAELYQGVRNEKEHKNLTSMLSIFTILPITLEVATQGGIYSSKYRASHGSGLADCLIAATVDLHGLTLRTLNAKHYPMLQQIEVPYKKN
ncbi:MAG: type II toxin-antitoxin system VapC family toxin [Chthoniobacterales bacterium]|nr:type II toxin-antitoxin system VapC family toxin [Chthoniobacterales bacterium]